MWVARYLIGNRERAREATARPELAPSITMQTEFGVVHVSWVDAGESGLKLFSRASQYPIIDWE